MSTPVPVSTAPRAAAPAAPAPPAEDQAGEGGESIATFASYKPTALPKPLVDILNGENCNHDQPAKQQVPAETTGPEIISLIDDDDGDDKMQDTENPSNDNAVNNGGRNALPEITCPSHTSLACESALLASVRAPLVPPSAADCLLDLAENKALSPLQLESILLAIQRHCRIFSGGVRAGFFIGDGAGVGKGRQIAAIIRNSLCRKNHTKRHVWLSVSRELVQDAKRDLTDVGVYCDVHDGTELLDKQHGLGIPNKGVLFCTYQLLVSNKRLEEIVSWCAGTDKTIKKSMYKQMEQEFNGCIILDEAHKAKNLKEETRTAQLVIELQRRLPKARVVYCSATGVSDVAHMAYAERLGLFKTKANQGNFSLFESFAEFQKALEQRGLGSLEMLALEMKMQGSFMARTLSWDGAEFQTLEIPLDKQQQMFYDQAVEWWTGAKKSLEEALDLPLMRANPPNKMIYRSFWSAHQRFFKELAICAKIPYLAQDAKQMVAQGCCCVFGLQTTGDASIQSILDQFKKKDQQFPSVLSTVKAIMTNFIKLHFPVAPGPLEPPKVPEPPGPNASLEEQRRFLLLQREAERIANLPPPRAIPELVARKQELLQKVESILLPPNPLDDLIDRLGGVDQVAELTGRPGRIVRTSSNHFGYSKRAEDANERVNFVEKQKFMDGTKPYAIISDAASTGISLHAARGSGASHKRRIHYTIELPWSADKAVQQLGRSHRSGQESAPIYKLVVTNLGGERRFAAAVSKRMASLGALTKGDRRAATGDGMLSDFDLDSRYGKRALKRFYMALATVAANAATGDDVHQIAMPSRNSEEILDKWYADQADLKDPAVKALPSILTLRRSAILMLVCGALDDVGLGSDTRKQSVDVKVFLNRIFGLPVVRQNLVFSLFMSTLDNVISEAKLTGEFEGSAEEIKATSMEISDEWLLANDPSCGAETKLVTLLLDRGISLETVSEMAKDQATEGNDYASSKVAETNDIQGEEPNAPDEKMDDGAEDDGSSEEEDDGWLSSSRPRRRTAECGFYVSKNKIAGRNLVLFAKPKFPNSSFKDAWEANDFDPLGLMVVTRPNTGTNPFEMPARDLDYKYRLALSTDKLKELLQKDAVDEGNGENYYPLSNVMKLGSQHVAKLWDAAFQESYHFEHKNGLAPRRTKVGLVTGAVLHILPTLEKVVMFRSTKERSLRIMRAEVPVSPDSTRRFVGVRFPADDEAIQKLDSEMMQLAKEHKAAGRGFHDEALAPICQKSTEWATTERKTMKSFFKVRSKDPPQNQEDSKNGLGPSLSAPRVSNKRSTPSGASTKKLVASSTKKARSITSFFSKK